MPQMPILTRSITAAGPIAVKRFINFAKGQNAVAGAAVLGVSDYAASGAGKQIAVTVLGVAEVETGAAVAEGDIIKSDATGRAIPQGGAGATVARALSAAAGAGGTIDVLLIPSAT